jgi:hypothetical protein
MKQLVLAAALITVAAFITPANALTTSGLESAKGELNAAQNVARVCREVCRGGFCRDICRWEPDRRRVRVFEERGRYRGDRDVEIRRERGPGVEFRVGPGRDY